MNFLEGAFGQSGQASDGAGNRSDAFSSFLNSIEPAGQSGHGAAETPADRRPAAEPHGGPQTPAAPPAGAAPGVAEPAGGEDYANMPWSEVGKRAMSNALPSAGRAFEGVYSAVKNYKDTAGAIGQIGSGLYSKAAGALGAEQDPTEKAANEAVVNAIGDMYSNRYGTASGFKQTLAEDPFAIGMDVASAVPMVGAGLRTAGLSGTANAISKVGALGDPITLAAKTVGTAGKLAAKPAIGAARYAQGAASGVPQSVLKIAENAGKSTDVGARDAFKMFASGKGDHRDIARAAMDAVDELKQAASAEYVARRGALATAELPMGSIMTALSDVKRALSPHGVDLFPGASTIVSQMEQKIHQVASAADPAARSAVGLDLLKRSLNDILNGAKHSPEVSGHVGSLGKVPQAVKDAISGFDPGYEGMMSAWEKWRLEMQDFQKTLGTSDRAAESARLAKLLSTAKRGDRMTLLNELAARTSAGKYLPYMIAGATVEHFLPQYLLGMGAAGIGMFTGSPVHGAAAAIAASPRLSGYTSYGVGSAMRGLDRVSDVASSYPPVVSNIASQLGNSQGGDRIGRKAGGRVGVVHEKLADQLVTAAERAKKDISAGTESLLDTPDDHVAKALEVANRSI